MGILNSEVDRLRKKNASLEERIAELEAREAEARRLLDGVDLFMHRDMPIPDWNKRCDAWLGGEDE